MLKVVVGALALVVAAVAAYVAFGDSDPGDSRPGGLSLTCRGPASPFSAGPGTITVMAKDGARPAADREVVWKLMAQNGILIDPAGGTAQRSRTDANGEATSTYILPFDLGWEGEVTVTAETAPADGPAARCGVRFTVRSPGIPTPRIPTPTR